MFFLSQINPESPSSIQKWLHSLVPVETIAQVIDQVQIAFIAAGAFILVVGYLIDCLEASTPIRPTFRIAALFATIAASPWFVTLGEAVVRGTVQLIASYAPNLNWLLVNNSSDYSMAMNFAKPYHILAQFVAGKFQADWPGLDFSKWGEYFMRVVLIGVVGIVAGITVFLMELVLVLQKLIMIGSRPFMPVFIAALSIPAASGQSRNFLIGVIGVICWPIGWATVHTGTMAALINLHPPAWNASWWELFVAAVTLGAVCAWMVVATVGAPWLMSRKVQSGASFAAGAVAGWATNLGRHVGNVIRAGGALGGGAVGAMGGAALGGPAGMVAGAAIGARAGASAGGAVASPVTTATQAAAPFNGTPQAAPSSRSAAAADLALQGLKSLAPQKKAKA
jgi:hypothetical protein